MEMRTHRFVVALALGLALLAGPAAAESSRTGVVERTMARLRHWAEAIMGNAEHKAGPCGGPTEHAGGIDPNGCPQASTQQVSTCDAAEHPGGTDPNGCPGR